MGPALAGFTTLLVGLPTDRWIGVGLLVAVIFSACQFVADRHAPNAAYLPLVRSFYSLLGPLMGAAVLCIVKATAVVPTLEPIDIALLTGVAYAGVALSRARLASWARDGGAVRIGIVGSARTAADLAAELDRSGRREFTVVGYIAPESADDATADALRSIGTTGGIVRAAAEHQIDLLLLSSDIPRLAAFEELSHLELDNTVRVIDLSAFYEEVFGHVALASINAAWFQWVLHPRYSPRIPPAKRALDLIFATVLMMVFAPLLAVLALLVRLDGGPAFFRQVRIGEGGREFVILKLRSMRARDPGDVDPRWSSPDDQRVTRIGAVLRRTHLDELPQLVNVLRGEMSIVGPRPEQPWFVDRLEQVIPFYARRHLVRPGITGWAQVHCGYAGSDVGSAMKVCHDLYYLKHRSVALDLLIICETLRAFVSAGEWDAETRSKRLALPTAVDGGFDESALDRGLEGARA